MPNMHDAESPRQATKHALCGDAYQHQGHTRQHQMQARTFRGLLVDRNNHVAAPNNGCTQKVRQSHAGLQTHANAQQSTYSRCSRSRTSQRTQCCTHSWPNAHFCKGTEPVDRASNRSQTSITDSVVSSAQVSNNQQQLALMQ